MAKGYYTMTPADLGNRRSYYILKKQLDACEATTSVPEATSGVTIAVILPNDCVLKKNLRDKFFEIE